MKRPAETTADEVQDESALKKTRLDENGDTTSDPASIVNLAYEDKLNYVSVIAKPMASRKMTKKLLKLTKKAAKKKGIVAGLKNVQKQIRRGDKGIIVIAGDVTPIDVISHLPVLCEENDIPFAFVPLRYDISAAMGVKRPCVMVMIRKNEAYDELYESCLTLVKSLPLPSQCIEQVE
ncbi:H/ACA ribonucleoprotein complex subunit 2-like protein [Tetranychus urticae]|uniref:H/ACA ribonucleoprotein complex subunit 2 n=1 Tax=Tetranychus urticae TaxID=32264 RepID=T1KPX9_TETUR|nr:H/ACA ribonucleoprotein complex subunit 2-like protein [Tetranychus urticae]